MTYDIPVDEDEGGVQMQLLGRRIARACVHFFQARLLLLLFITDNYLPSIDLIDWTDEHNSCFVGSGGLVSS